MNSVTRRARAPGVHVLENVDAIDRDQIWWASTRGALLERHRLDPPSVRANGNHLFAGKNRAPSTPIPARPCHSAWVARDQLSQPVLEEHVRRPFWIVTRWACAASSSPCVEGSSFLDDAVL